MYCSTCGFQISKEALQCPRCGTQVVSHTTENAGIANDATVPSSSPYLFSQNPPYNNSPQVPPSPPVSTSYGVDPYRVPPPPPYQQSAGPYSMSPLPAASYPPHTPPPLVSPVRKKGPGVGLILGIALLILVVIGGSLFFVLRSSVPSVVVDPSANPYAPKTGTLVLNDPLQDNTRGYQWDESSSSPTNNANDTSACAFTGGVYHLSETQKGGLVCNPESPAIFLRDSAFEVKVTITQGDDAGVVIREDQSKLSGYIFFIDSQGNYTLETTDSAVTANNKTLRSGKNAAIKQGLKQTNLVAVVANGDTIDSYVNDTLVTSVQDATFSNGQVGLYAAGLKTAYDVAASNARLWSIGKATPTLSAAQNPYFPRTGTPVINDPMSDNSKGYAWDEINGFVGNNKNDVSICAFSGGIYHISRTMTGGQSCMATGQGLVFSDLAYQAKMTLNTGDLVYGYYVPLRCNKHYWLPLSAR